MLKKTIETEKPDLAFLPEYIQTRIRNIFDKYLMLGLQDRTSVEGNLPQFPNKFSALSSNEAGDIHMKYAAWTDYASGKLKYLKTAQTVLSFEKNKAFKQALAKQTGNVTERKILAETDEVYLSVLEYETDLNALVAMVEKEVEALDKQVMAIRAELRRKENTPR